jgi:hypothetical protein
MIEVKARRKVVAEIDQDQRCVVIGVDADWVGVVAPAVEKAQAQGDLGSQKVLVIRDGQPLLLNGWSVVIRDPVAPPG